MTLRVSLQDETAETLNNVDIKEQEVIPISEFCQWLYFQMGLLTRSI